MEKKIRTMGKEMGRIWHYFLRAVIKNTDSRTGLSGFNPWVNYFSVTLGKLFPLCLASVSSSLQWTPIALVGTPRV